MDSYIKSQQVSFESNTPTIRLRTNLDRTGTEQEKTRHRIGTEQGQNGQEQDLFRCVLVL